MLGLTSAEANGLATFLALDAGVRNAEVIPDQRRAPEIALETSSR
jgi:hypothetical protein